MTQSKTTKKTAIPGTQPSYRLPPKTNRRTPPRNKRQKALLESELQRDLRHIHNLYIADKKHQETILAEYKRAKDSLTMKMEHLGHKQLKCEGTNFGILLKERTHHTFDDDIVRLEHELKAEKQIAIDTGKTTKDITIYASVFIEK